MMLLPIVLLLSVALGSHAQCIEWSCPDTDTFNNPLSRSANDDDLLICDYGQYTDPENGYILYASKCTYDNGAGELIEDDGATGCPSSAFPNVLDYFCPQTNTNGTALSYQDTSNPSILACTYGYLECQYDPISGQIALDSGDCPTLSCS